MSDHELVSEQRLEAQVQQEGEGVFIEVPAEVMAKLSPRKRPPILVTLNGYTYRSTPAVYAGRYYLGLRREVRDAAGVRVGQTLHVTIQVDEQHRLVDVPADLAQALRADRAARAAFDRLSFTDRREYVEWVGTAKLDATRRRRVAETIKRLRADKPQ